MSTPYDPRIWAYFHFAFYAGLRPEEMIALCRSDIDFNNKIARVQRVRTFKGSKGGKPVAAAPWHEERSQRENYWQPTLKRLGIRMRRAYNTRHLY